jgi:hypothetical protein
MRQHFEPQVRLGTVPISEVNINMKSRHELPPVLKALQHIFVTPDLKEQVFGILDKKVLSGKAKTGRWGMSLWEIFVLGVVRLCMDIDYDFLVDQANEHRAMRGILGVQTSDYSPGKEYQYQTVVDNVSLLDEQTLSQINEVIVKSGHSILKKKRGPRRKRK